MADSAKAHPTQPPAPAPKGVAISPDKVLRIGIVQAGKVVHERLIAPGQSVSVGESPKNTFVVPAKSLPKRFTLFQAKGDKYFLNFTEAMKGKISFQDSIKGLDELSGGGQAVKKGDVHVLHISGNTRGKIVFDDVTVLFQFVPPPPVSLKNLGRTDFRPTLLDGDDLVFFGFLALFAAMAMVFVVYVYSVEPVELVALEDIPERFVDIVLPPQDDQKQPELPTENATVKKEVEKQADDKKQSTAKRELTQAEKDAAEAARQEKLKQQVLQQSKLLAGILGTRGDSNGDPVEDVFAENDMVGSSLDEALKNVSGADMASADKLGVKQGVGGGRGDANIGDLARGGGGSASIGTGPSTAVKAKSTVGDIDAGSGEGADAVKTTIRKYGGQVKYCYETQLKTNQGLAGRLAIDMTITNGRVSSVSIGENGTGSKSLEECVLRKVRMWRFPEGVSAEGVYLPYILSAE
jgi:hypothetical protein